MVKRFFTVLLQLVLIAFLAFLAQEAWNAYRQEQLNVLFEKEGKPVQVTIRTVSHEKKTWKDYIGNSKYIGFRYHDKIYNLRYFYDSSGWVGAGSLIWLQYDSKIDGFRQGGIRYHAVAHRNQSKLTSWSVLRIFSYAHRWLFAVAVLVLLVLLLSFSIMANITGLTLFKLLADGLVVCCFLGGGLFFTWDAWQHYQYYRQLQTNGLPAQVPLVAKHRTIFPKHDDDGLGLYDYSATVRYRQGEREIVISHNDYDRLVAGEPMAVLYEAGLDDMMSADYSFAYWKWVFLVLMWGVILYILGKRSDPGEPS